jgi:tetratricopeptide (TPR) repeat protein
MRLPLCFVLMPFGKKPDAAGLLVDFDAVYRELIAPAINEAGLEPLRADEELAGGIIHKPMFERLILCEYAVADLTAANANVFYELGIRHAVRPATTVLLFSEKSRLPFDLALLRAFPYPLNSAGGPENVENTRKGIAERLRAAKSGLYKDSPVFQLVENFPDLQRLKTDVFRDRVEYAARFQEKLAESRRQKRVEAVKAVEQELGNIADQESGVVIDLFLSYRAVKSWTEMIRLVDQMSEPLRQTVMVQEQLGLALNRAGQGEKAEQILQQLIQRRGPSSETYGILGRVYKDRWDAALKRGDLVLARGLLDKAINAYLSGFEADWRDAYPGINAVTLMTLRNPPDPRREQLLPVVNYAVERRIAAGKPDYWDYATRLELAVLRKDQTAAEAALSDALTAIREPWEPETTAQNLRLICGARAERNQVVTWADPIEQELQRRANG